MLFRLKAEKERIKLKQGVTRDEELQDSLELPTSTTPKEGEIDAEGVQSATRVRWLRINTLKWSNEQATDWLAENDYPEVSHDAVLTSKRLGQWPHVAQTCS